MKSQFITNSLNPVYNIYPGCGIIRSRNIRPGWTRMRFACYRETEPIPRFHKITGAQNRAPTKSGFVGARFRASVLNQTRWLVLSLIVCFALSFPAIAQEESAAP